MKSATFYRLLVFVVLTGILGVAACDSGAKKAAAPPTPADKAASAAAPAAKPQAAPQAAPAAPAREPAAGEKRPPVDPMADKPAAKLPGGTAFPPIAPKEDDEPPARPKRDLGPPLVENPKDLVKLNPEFPVWLDAKNKRVVMVGEVCRATMGLEMFACLLASEKDYESVVVIDTKAAIVHAALLATGAVPGSPVQFLPEYRSASGTEIDIELIWKDPAGKLRKSRAQEWMKDVRTGKPIQESWVFAGSSFWKNETTKEEYYLGEGGYLVCVANNSSAVLDLPIPSSAGLEARLFETNVDVAPPRGTPVTMILAPRLDKPPVKPAPPSKAAAQAPTDEKGRPLGTLPTDPVERRVP